jgi:hypothetical protein
MTTSPPSNNTANASPAPLGVPALQATLAAIDTLVTLARKNHHPRIIALAYIIRLRVLLRAGAWTQVGVALDTAEAVLGLMFDKDGKVNNDKDNINAMVNAKPDDDALPRWNSITAHDVNALSREYSRVRITSHQEPKSEEESTQSDPAHASLVIHTLLSGTIFFTFSGNIRAAEQRLVALHKIVDSGALEGFKDGIVRVRFLSLFFVFLSPWVLTTPRIDSSPTAPSLSSPYHPPTYTSPAYISRECHCKTGPSGQKPKKTALGRSSNQYSQYCKRGY